MYAKIANKKGTLTAIRNLINVADAEKAKVMEGSQQRRLYTTQTGIQLYYARVVWFEDTRFAKNWNKGDAYSALVGAIIRGNTIQAMRNAPYIQVSLDRKNGREWTKEFLVQTTIFTNESRKNEKHKKNAIRQLVHTLRQYP